MVSFLGITRFIPTTPLLSTFPTEHHLDGQVAAFFSHCCWFWGNAIATGDPGSKTCSRFLLRGLAVRVRRSLAPGQAAGDRRRDADPELAAHLSSWSDAAIGSTGCEIRTRHLRIMGHHGLLGKTGGNQTIPGSTVWTFQSSLNTEHNQTCYSLCCASNRGEGPLHHGTDDCCP